MVGDFRKVWNDIVGVEVLILLSECKSKQNIIQAYHHTPTFTPLFCVNVYVQKSYIINQLNEVVGQNYYYSTFASNNMPLSPHCRGEV